MNWYYFDNSGNKQGPFSSAQLKTLAANGTIQPTTQVTNDSGTVSTANKVKGLFQLSVPNEQTLYSKDGTIVTPRRVVLNGVTISVGQIATVSRTETERVEYPTKPPASPEEEAAGCWGTSSCCWSIIFGD